MHIFNSPRLIERSKGLELIEELNKDRSKCIIIHYSCESFITNHGRTPRITSISVKNLNSGQTKSFSIHLQSQFDNIDITGIDDKSYDQLEKNMLKEFSEYVKTLRGYKWIHWNMRDSNYGFEAINNRIRILKGQVFEIEDDRKYDLPKILGLLYTYNYEDNQPKGRLLNLAVRNNIGIKNALPGNEEAKAFDNKEYLKLHMSTLKKLDVIESIFDKTQAKQLTVNVQKKYIYGLTIPGIIVLVKESPMLILIASVISYIAGTAFAPLVQKAFHTGGR